LFGVMWISPTLPLRYLSYLRETYHKPGARLELPMEQKLHLGLQEAASWARDYLLDLQNRIAEPLILYWYSMSISFKTFVLEKCWGTFLGYILFYTFSFLFSFLFCCCCNFYCLVKKTLFAMKCCHSLCIAFSFSINNTLQFWDQL